MSDVSPPRYGNAPTAAFAATRASAEQRRAREAAAAMTSSGGERASRSKQLRLRITTLLTKTALTG